MTKLKVRNSGRGRSKGRVLTVTGSPGFHMVLDLGSPEEKGFDILMAPDLNNPLSGGHEELVRSLEKYGIEMDEWTNAVNPWLRAWFGRRLALHYKVPRLETWVAPSSTEGLPS